MEVLEWEQTIELTVGLGRYREVGAVTLAFVRECAPTLNFLQPVEGIAWASETGI